MKQTISIPLPEKILNFLRNEAVLSIAFILALVSSLFAMPKLEYIDFKVLILLFNLMIVVAAFKEYNLLDYLATSILKKCTNYKSICFALVTITLLSSMIVTNDVALITFVPLTIVICKKANISSLKIIILQTIAANLGSSFTPMGNPQNLYIYSYFNINPIEFFKLTMPLLIVSIIFLIILMSRVDKKKLDITLKEVSITNKNKLFVFISLFIFILLSVFHLIDYRIAFLVTALVVLLLNNKLFKKVDYSLILTFIFFFIFIGNISSMDSIKVFMENLLASKSGTYFSSILLSQGISNVPCTMLLSNFTTFYKELLLGVNIGGLGTIIASMASVISYKLYQKDNALEGNKFIKIFSIYNVLGLIILIPIFYLL